MAFNQFNFAQADWLWGLLLIPFIWGLYGFFSTHQPLNPGWKVLLMYIYCRI